MRVCYDPLNRSRRRHSFHVVLLRTIATISTIHVDGALQTSTRHIHGQRCLLVPSAVDISGSSDNNPTLAPPLLLLPGLAQSIGSYEQLHIPTFSRRYPGPILVYEGLGFGPSQASMSNIEDNNNDGDCQSSWTKHVTFPKQIERLLQVLDSDPILHLTNRPPQLQHVVSKWNVVGYSWGARLAMALGATHPERLHKIHLTGVALNRSPAGHIALQSWKSLLQVEQRVSDATDADPHHYETLQLRAFAWSALQATYSSNSLVAQNDKLETWVHFLCRTNTVHGLSALLQQTYPIDSNDPWHIHSMARRIRHHQRNRQIDFYCRLIVGEKDAMAPLDSAQKLAEEMGMVDGARHVHIVPNCGYAVPLEQPRAWRQDVLEFLLQDDAVV